VFERRSITSHDANLLPPSSAAICLLVYHTTTLDVRVRTNSLDHPGDPFFFLNHREAV